jgi:ABC-type transport system substrate-binding protein
MRMKLSLRSLATGSSLVAATALVMASGAVAGASSARPQAQPKPVYGGTLTLDTQTNPQTLDPAKTSDVVSGQFIYLMYNTLVTYAPTSTQIVPSLAVRWKHSPDGKTWWFWLRKGVTFWNGDPVTAQDVVWTFTRLNEQVVAAPYQYSFADLVGAQQIFNETKTLADVKPNLAISGVKALGPYEVEMQLVNPELYWLNVLALPSASIEDPAVAKNYTADESGKTPKPITPMGTGPFELQPVGASPTQYVFTKNPHYFIKGLPYLNKIIINIGAPPQLQFEQFLKGQIQAMPTFLTNFGLAPAVYLEVERNPQLKKEYYRVPDNGFGYLGFNVQVKPFNNLYVREAVEYAINKQQILTDVFNGRGIIANSILPPAMPGYQANFNPFPVSYTPAGMKKADAMAKALLKKAGYTSFPVNLGTFYVPQGPGDTQLAALVTTQLAAAGMKVTPKIVGFGPFLTLGETTNKLDFYSLGWTQDYPDPQDFLFNLFDSAEAGGNNFDYYKNPLVDRWLQIADTSLHQDARLKLYDKIQDYVMDQAAVVPYVFNVQDGLIGPNAYPKDPVYWAHPVQPAELDRVWVTGG